MTNLVVALLLTVGSAQEKPRAQPGDDLKRLGEITNDHSDVQIQIRKAKLDVEQVDIAEQILLNKLVRDDEELQRMRNHHTLVAAEMNRLLRKDDPVNADVQGKIQRLRQELKLATAMFDVRMTVLRGKVRHKNPQLQKQRDAANKEIERLRKDEMRLSAELDRCINRILNKR